MTPKATSPSPMEAGSQPGSRYLFAGRVVACGPEMAVLEGCDGTPCDDPPAITIGRAGSVSASRGPYALVHEWPRGALRVMRSAAGAFRLDFPTGERFVIRAGEHPAVVDVDADPGRNATVNLLLDQVLPRVLAHQGCFLLHAALVRKAGRALLIIGDSGAGKSTLAAALEKSGYELLADDACLVETAGQTVRARATYPSLRLWPESVRAVFGDDIPHRLTPSHQSRGGATKFRLQRGRSRCRPCEVVDCIVLLGQAQQKDVVARKLSRSSACMSLIAASFQLDPVAALRTGSALVPASAVASRVPLIDLSFPRDFARLGEVCAVVDAVASNAVAMSAGRSQEVSAPWT